MVPGEILVCRANFRTPPICLTAAFTIHCSFVIVSPVATTQHNGYLLSVKGRKQWKHGLPLKMSGFSPWSERGRGG